MPTTKKKKSRSVHISTLLSSTDLNIKTNNERELKVVAKFQELVWHSRGFFGVIILVQLFDSLTAVYV